MSRRHRLYLAGPDVFLPDPVAAGERRKWLCAEYGFEGVFPMDAVADLRGLSPRDTGLKIGGLNEELIRSCDGVVANMTPFRGPSADVGTAYEMGYAAGLGRVVCAYTNVATPFTQRTVAFLGGNVAPSGGDTGLRDADGMALEDFGLADNLMLESSIARTGGCLVIHNAPPGEAFTALDGFERCLDFLRSGPLSGS